MFNLKLIDNSFSLVYLPYKTLFTVQLSEERNFAQHSVKCLLKIKIILFQPIS